MDLKKRPERLSPLMQGMLEGRIQPMREMPGTMGSPNLRSKLSSKLRRQWEPVSQACFGPRPKFPAGNVLDRPHRLTPALYIAKASAVHLRCKKCSPDCAGV